METNDVDREALESYLTRLRPFCLKEEALFLPTVVNRAMKHATTKDEKADLRWLRRVFERGHPEGMVVNVGDRRFTDCTLLDAYMNAWVFHRDPEKDRMFRNMATSPVGRHMTDALVMSGAITRTNVILALHDWLKDRSPVSE